MLAHECMDELDAIGIPYSKNVTFEVNTTAKRRWGLCTHLSGGRHRIQISHLLLADDIPDNSAKSVIIHELLHTCPKTNGHTKLWRAYADKVNAFYNYDIQRTAGYEDLRVQDPEEYKYIVACPQCGYQWKYHRLSASVRNLLSWKCAKCHVHPVLIKGTIPEGAQEKSKQPKFKYACKNCGAVVTRTRECKFTRNYTHYRCGVCGGKFEKI